MEVMWLVVPLAMKLKRMSMVSTVSSGLTSDQTINNLFTYFLGICISQFECKKTNFNFGLNILTNTQIALNLYFKLKNNKIKYKTI